MSVESSTKPGADNWDVTASDCEINPYVYSASGQHGESEHWEIAGELLGDDGGCDEKDTHIGARDALWDWLP
jgi:hypothetical protein